ncbi:MAG: hypothetical protein ACOYLH_02545 [Flavobacteriales bacterium]
MKNALVYIVFCLIWSCQSDETENRRIILNGFYRLDNDSANVQLGFFSSEGIFETISSDELYVVGENEIPLVLDNMVYVNQDNVLSSGDSVWLKWNGQVVAAAGAPPAINVTDMGNSNIVIDVDSPGQEVFDIAWTNLGDNYSYVLTLTNLEESPVLIPFDTESGLFTQLYNGPIEEHNALLYDIDFRYYGAHRLTVYAVEKEFAEVFFYRTRSGLDIIQTGQDNVSGAIGFWGATRAFEVLLNVQ